jgi:hypothetical protein
MDDYPYAILGADRWFRCDGLHTMAAHTNSSGWGAARSMWTFRLTPLTQL